MATAKYTLERRGGHIRPMNHEYRFYREFVQDRRWHSYRVKVKTSDLLIKTQGKHVKLVQRVVRRLRKEIETEIKINQDFLTSLSPLALPQRPLPAVVQSMYKAASMAGSVGPMAAVAGAVAEFTGRALKEKSKEVIIENGGDIFLDLKNEAKLAIYAGKSPLSGKLGLRIKARETPIGVCTSSGKIGHSLSLGRADSVTIIAADTALADAVATATANLVTDNSCFPKALAYALSIPQVLGAVIIKDAELAVQGDLELITLT